MIQRSPPDRAPARSLQLEPAGRAHSHSRIIQTHQFIGTHLVVATNAMVTTGSAQQSAYLLLFFAVIRATSMVFLD